MKYKKEIYEIIKPYYEEFLNNPDDEKELIDVVDSLDIYEIFRKVCEWNGLRPSVVELVYETCFGKGIDKGDVEFFSI